MGVYRSSPMKEKETVVGVSKNGKMKFAACGMQGWRVTMEDAHIAKFDVEEDLHVFGVFDGHGGREVARYVQSHFIEELIKNENFKKHNFPVALEETFQRMDDLMRTGEARKELAEHQKNGGDQDDHRGGEFESMAGCTANVAVIYKNMLYVANAGDSRSCLCDGGRAIELSMDHKPELDLERDRITKAGGYVTDGRINGNLNLSRALGDFEYKKNSSIKPKEQLVICHPDVKQFELKPSAEFILMGCDGIWESLSNEEIVAEVGKLIQTKQGDLKASVEALLDKLIAPDTTTGIGCDNMSSIIISLK